MTTKDPQEWARKINISMASSVAAIIETGRAFLDAKKELDHGDFQRLFANHPDPLPEPVSCSPGTAQRLMKIASNPVLAKAAHAPVLPCSWMTLYELTKVPDDRLEIALQEGWIRPEMQRSDVKELRGIERTPQKARAPKVTDKVIEYLPHEEIHQPGQNDDAVNSDDEPVDIDAIPNATEEIERVIKRLIYRLPDRDQQQLLLAIETLVAWYRKDLEKIKTTKQVEAD